MKKILIALILFISITSYAKFPTNQTKFIIQANHYYEFSIYLKKDTSYSFFLQAQKPGFNFQIIEPSGNAWEMKYTIIEQNMLIKENILDEGIYKIKIYSIDKNLIKLTWREYE